MQLTEWTKLRKSILFQTTRKGRKCCQLPHLQRQVPLILSKEFFPHSRQRRSHGKSWEMWSKLQFQQKACVVFFKRGLIFVLRLISFTCHGVYCTVKLLIQIKFFILRTHPQLITLFFLTGLYMVYFVLQLIKRQILPSCTQKRCWGIICLRQFWTEPPYKVILKGRPSFRSAFHLRRKVARTQLRWKHFQVLIW